MEQLKGILQILKKHLFWLLCVACAVTGLLGWKMASGKLSDEYGKKKSEITGKFSALDGIRSTENFPNAQWKEGIDKITIDQKAKVREAWKRVYDEQAKLLAWPGYLNQPGKDFVSLIKKSPEGAIDIEETARERYMNMIPREFDNLVTIVGATAAAEENTDGRARTTVTTPPPKQDQPAGAAQEDRVVWDEASQKKVRDAVSFPEGTPTAQRVFLTQEDLWIYQVLLTIIKNVNAGQIVPQVKKIDELLIGKEAADKLAGGLASGKIEVPKDNAAAGAPAEPPPQQTPPEPTPGQQVALDEGRYLDAEGKALAAGGTGDTPYKRMPVFMKLVIDQSQIAKLLVECANSPLPVEVHQWRINPGAGNASPGATQSGSGSTSGGTNSDSTNDVPIELSGIIYIYNPPDTTKLGGDAAAGAAPGDAAAPAAPGG